MKWMIKYTCLLLLSGCRVGPDYQAPVMNVPEAYSEVKEEQSIVVSDNDLIQWWHRFQDPHLDRLLEEATENNFDIAIALERVYQARSQYWIQFTNILPNIQSDFQASHYRVSQAFESNVNNINNTVPTPSINTKPINNFFQLGFDAIWEIDLFGRLQRTAASSYNTLQARDEDLRDIKITILSEVVNTYTLIRGSQKKVEIAKQTVELDKDLVHLARIRMEAGLATLQDLLTFEGTYEGDKANLKQQETLLKQNIYSLATLLGRLPETLICEFEKVNPIPNAVGLVPIAFPCDLLRRRHDVRSLERQLAAASEQIGIAMAELYPKFSLTGSASSFAGNPLQGANFGWASDRISKLLTTESKSWGIGGLVTFPIFDWGQRLANIDVQTSLFNQAYLNYQKSVINAFQEVERALVTYFNDEERVNFYRKQVEINKQNLDLTTALYSAGLADYIQLIQIKNAWLLSQNALADSEQTLATDLIAIYKAMGGDW